MVVFDRNISFLKQKYKFLGKMVIFERKMGIFEIKILIFETKILVFGLNRYFLEKMSLFIKKSHFLDKS